MWACGMPSCLAVSLPGVLAALLVGLPIGLLTCWPTYGLHTYGPICGLPVIHLCACLWLSCAWVRQILYLQVYLLAPAGTYCISLSGGISWATYGPTDGLSCGLPVAFAMNLDVSLLLGLAFCLYTYIYG
jgi:type III secretory pathway component EscS